ncbi:hypothetical protein REPUB_Repub09cG0010400 [Reevesia pubescens]
METTNHQVLEINLISAQGLKEPSFKLHHHMKTYAVVWVDPSTKLHSRVDRLGAKNPTWNDKFLFEVSPQFLLGKTSAISVEIYAVAAAMKTPAFGAYLIGNPSGDSFRTLNIGGMVLDPSADFRALSKVSGVDYHYLTGENLDDKHHLRTNNKSKAPVTDIMEYIPGDNQSEADDSIASSSAPPHTVVRDLILKDTNEDDHGVLPPEKETLIEEDQKEEITSINMEEPPTANLMPPDLTEKAISDNEGSMVKMEKDVKMMMEENEKLREMVEMLVLETKGQSTVISDLSGKVKRLERKLSRRNKQRKPHNYGRTAFASKLFDAAEGKPSV